MKLTILQGDVFQRIKDIPPEKISLGSLYHGDCMEVMRDFPDASIDAIVCDPPYGLEFMGKGWDAWDRRDSVEESKKNEGVGAFLRAGKNLKGYRAGQSFQDWSKLWATEALRVLKPGGFMFAFGGTRTYHRMACGIEDAGFVIKDCIKYCYASGFPKSQDLAMMIEKKLGGKVEDRKAALPLAKSWSGWGTAQLKPCYEPIVVAQKPVEGTIAENTLKYGVGGYNIDAARIPFKSLADHTAAAAARAHQQERCNEEKHQTVVLTPNGDSRLGRDPQEEYDSYMTNQGRFPPNLLSEDGVLDDGDADSQNRYFDLDAWFSERIKKLPKEQQNEISKAINSDKNINTFTDIIKLWETNIAEEENGLRKENTNARDVVSISGITRAIEEGKNTISVQGDVRRNLGSQNQNQDVLSVGENVDYTETITVPKLVQIKHGMETLLQTLTKESITPITQNEQTPISQNDANYVIQKIKDWSDIIQIFIDQPRLFGYARRVIITQMRQDLSEDQLWQNFWQERIKRLPKNQQRTFPFLFTSKASRSEKNEGLEGELKHRDKENPYQHYADRKNEMHVGETNTHPTVKSIKILSYLITLATRENATVLDCFLGSGSTALACELMGRKWIGIEKEEEYVKIARGRLNKWVGQARLSDD